MRQARGRTLGPVVALARPRTLPHLAIRPGHRAGARAMATWLPGMATYGLVVGVAAGKADVPALAGWLTGPLFYSGGAQVAAVGLFDAGAATFVVVATVLAINARLLVYSAASGAHWRDTPRWWRALACYLLVDPSFAVGADGYARADAAGGEAGALAEAHDHYMGAAVVLCATWLTASGIGVLSAGALPTGLQLAFVVPLFLLGETQRRITDRTGLRAAVVAIAVATVGRAMPLHLGVLTAIVAGLTVAALSLPSTPTSEDHR
ncbi:MAG TPA: AzlC family ABC transporter permease [Acidimicrobiales bacterium]